MIQSLSSNYRRPRHRVVRVGCDYVDPGVFQAGSERFKRVASANGLIPEYYNGVTGEVDDPTNSTINDDTPLYDPRRRAHVPDQPMTVRFLDEMYPSVEKAAD